MVRKLPDNSPQYPPHREDIYDLARVIKRRVWFLESRMQTAETSIQDLSAGGGGGGGAPTGAEYLVGQSNGSLTNELVVTDTPTIEWTLAGGLASAGVPAGGISTTELGGDITASGKALLDDADNAAQRTTLGLGDSAVLDVGNAAGTVCAGDDARLSNDRTADSLRTASGVVLVGSASAPTSGQVLTADGAGNADWQTPASGGSDDIVHADAKMTAVAMSTTYEVLGEKTITVAAGDLIEVHCSGTLENNSGATKTFGWRLEIIANGNTETVVVQDATTVASSAVNKSPWLYRSSTTITASQCHTVVLSTRSAPIGSTATGGSTSGSMIRMMWAQDANDYTGSCTLRLSGRVTAATTNTWINVQHFWIQQTPARP